MLTLFSGTLRSAALTTALVLGGAAALAEGDRIVGIGATTCAHFNQDLLERPASERDYIAWAQGFMSGALMRAPPGVDESLELLPSSFPIQKQAEFLSAFCAGHPDQDYMDAVRALYHRLQGPAT